MSLSVAPDSCRVILSDEQSEESKDPCRGRFTILGRCFSRRTVVLAPHAVAFGADVFVDFWPMGTVAGSGNLPIARCSAVACNSLGTMR